MNSQIILLFICTIYCIGFVCGSPVETKNDTDITKLVPTNIQMSAVTPVVPSSNHEDLQLQNERSDTKNGTVISDKTTGYLGAESVPAHTEAIITTAKTTVANITSIVTPSNHTINISSNKTQEKIISTNSTSPATTTPDQKTAPFSEVTSPKPPTTVTVSSTTTHTVTILPPSKVEEKEKDRGFDGPSFIGGIVLPLGLTGIGFVAYKFCKARTDRNYRNL